MTVRLHPVLSAELGKKISNAVHLRLSELSFTGVHDCARKFIEISEEEIAKTLDAYREVFTDEEMDELSVDLTRWTAAANASLEEDDG